MTNKTPSSCRPDKHLTESHLQELYDDFSASLATARPPAFIFTSLVTNVRMAYKDALGEAREELLHKSENYARQLAELKLEGKEELKSRPRASLLEVTPSDGNNIDALDKATKPALPCDPSQTWHIARDTFSLYIFSNTTPYRRDWADWNNTGKEGGTWQQRLILKVFKFQGPGTVRVYAMQKDSPDRILFVRGKGGLDERWKDSLEFWAYDKPRPETVRVWSGFQDGPQRGIVVRGNQERMEEWEEKCEFWVPI